MASFNEDLKMAFRFASRISEQRSVAWNTNARPLLLWQKQAFATFIEDFESGQIDAAWSELGSGSDKPWTVDLLHQELAAIVAFQRPLAEDVLTAGAEPEVAEREPSRRKRPLKKAMELIKAFLESLKEILGDVLGIRGKAILQIAIEAAGAFS